jgi:hypothetical protein
MRVSKIWGMPLFSVSGIEHSLYLAVWHSLPLAAGALVATIFGNLSDSSLYEKGSLVIGFLVLAEILDNL